MKTFIKSLDLKANFLLFIFGFAYIQSIYNRIDSRTTINQYTFTPEAAVATFLGACIIFFLLGGLIYSFRHKIKSNDWIRLSLIFFMALLLYLVFSNVVSWLLAWSFGTIDRNFSVNQIIQNNLSLVLNFFTYGGFYLLYFLYRKNQKDQQQILQYNQALSATKIAQLKSQLNPHFLFNNLNALDQLIAENPKAASDFLNDFADLYRYALKTSDQSLVALADELDFALSYFKLMKHKYGQAFTLQRVGQENSAGYLPPLTLQLLLENVFDHSMATTANPVHITLQVSEQWLTVSNNHIPKRFPKKDGGRSLQNLKEQYALLTTEVVHIDKTAVQFTIRIPLLQSNRT